MKHKVWGTISLKGISVIDEQPVDLIEGGKLLHKLEIDSIASPAVYEQKGKEIFLEHYGSKENLPFTAIVEEEQIPLLATNNSLEEFGNVLLLFNGSPENNLDFMKLPFTNEILDAIHRKLCELMDSEGNPLYKHRDLYMGARLIKKFGL